MHVIDATTGTIIDIDNLYVVDIPDDASDISDSEAHDMTQNPEISTKIPPNLLIGLREDDVWKIAKSLEWSAEVDNTNHIVAYTGRGDPDQVQS